MSKYIKEYERYIIETMLKDGKKPTEIAQRINKALTTVYREIKRGTVTLRDTHLKEYKVYCADVSQRKYNENKQNKGVTLKLENDTETIDIIEKLILEYKYSPYAVYVYLKQSEQYTNVCYKTIYNYIHNNIFKNISNKNLTYKKKDKEEKEKEKRPSLKMLGATSIEERPKEVYKRDMFGNWEMVTVYSGKGKCKECLLVLTERVTRQEIVRKIKDRTADSVLNEINAIEKKIGCNKFRNIFKSITCDNGVEFSKFKEIELSCTKNCKRTKLYFCHPFNSCERGSNENANKLIRKYIPKGDIIANYSNDFIKQMENIINDYPRKLFNGLSSNQYSKNMGFPIIGKII